jgi:hypothetical protein
MHKNWLAMVLTMLAVSPLAQAGAGKEQGEAPSEVHKKLAKRAGDYDLTIKFTLPDGKSMESKGMAKLAMILDGRFLQEDNAGTMRGMPFTGKRLLGYNVDAGQYEALWMYTGSTGMMTLVGQSKQDGKVIEFVASYTAAKNKKGQLHGRVSLRHRGPVYGAADCPHRGRFQGIDDASDLHSQEVMRPLASIPLILAFQVLRNTA